MTRIIRRTQAWAFGVFGVVAVLSLAVLGGCESIYEIENPNQITDEALNNPTATAPLAAGVAGDFMVALGGGGQISFLCEFDAIITDEAQHVGSFPTFREVDDVNQPLTLDNLSLTDMYRFLARARFVADDAIRRIKEVNVDTVWGRDANVASILIYGGYAYAFLGDYYNGAPIDGGPKLTRAQLYQEAIDRFTEAVTIAGNAGNTSLPGRVATAVGNVSAANLALRANAGLARVHRIISPTNLATAVTYADLASPSGSTSFLFNAVFSLNSTRENNYWNWANRVRNEVSVSPEVRALYAANPTDTRIATTRATGSGGIGGDGAREWWLQSKFTGYDSPIRIAGWQEMELIRAERYIQQNDLVNAVAAINRVRAAVAGLAARGAAANATEALDWLKYERRAEFFWEGRRMADLRHYGTTADLALIKTTPPFFPIPQAERDTNPNPMD